VRKRVRSPDRGTQRSRNEACWEQNSHSAGESHACCDFGEDTSQGLRLDDLTSPAFLDDRIVGQSRTRNSRHVARQAVSQGHTARLIARPSSSPGSVASASLTLGASTLRSQPRQPILDASPHNSPQHGTESSPRRPAVPQPWPSLPSSKSHEATQARRILQPPRCFLQAVG